MDLVADDIPPNPHLFKMGSQESNTDIHFLSNFYHGFLKSPLSCIFVLVHYWLETGLSFSSPELTKLFSWNSLGSLLELQCMQLALQVPSCVGDNTVTRRGYGLPSAAGMCCRSRWV